MPAPRMRLPRFTTLQLLLAATLVALVLGLFMSAWRAQVVQECSGFCFSPGGEHLAILGARGGLQVWQIDTVRPRLIAHAYSKQPRERFEIDTMMFMDDNRVLKVEYDFIGDLVHVRQFATQTQRFSEITQLTNV